MSARKPVERRARRNAVGAGMERSLRALPARTAAVPSVPDDLLASSGEAWARFWASDIAALVAPSDMDAVVDLFRLYDEAERAYRTGRRKRLILGSTGQLVLNPLLKYAADCRTEARAIEDRLGKTPLARLKLGAQFGDMARSLEEANKRLERDSDEGPDPRLAAVELADQSSRRKGAAEPRG